MKERNDREPGYVYVVSKLHEPKKVKIGLTRNVKARMWQLTNDYGQLRIVAIAKTSNMAVLENRMHRGFRRYNYHEAYPKTGRTEWFYLDLIQRMKLVVCLHWINFIMNLVDLIPVLVTIALVILFVRLLFRF